MREVVKEIMKKDGLTYMREAFDEIIIEGRTYMMLLMEMPEKFSRESFFVIVFEEQ